MAVNLSSLAGVAWQFFDNNGNPLSGGLVYTYDAGTTTPAVTYTSITGITAHSNPIVLDAAGRVPGGEIWLTEAAQYKFVIKDSVGVQIGSYDNVTGYISSSIPSTITVDRFTGTGAQVAFVLSTVPGGIANTQVYINGVYQDKNTYSLAGVTLTFSAAPPVGSDIEVIIFATLTVGLADAANVTYNEGGTGAVTTSVQAKLQEVVSVKDFGAVGDGTTDDLLAFQAAALAAKCVYIPTGTYLITGTVNISLSGSHWYGDGTNASIITSNSTTLPMFTASAGITGFELNDFTLTRSVTATSGADGVKCSIVSVGQASFNRLLVEKQYNGFSLGPTDWSQINDVISQKNQNIGFYITNTSTDGACQWSFDTCLAQMNNAQGFFVEAQNTGPTQITVGTLKNCATFANTGYGVSFVGLAAIPVQGVRIIGGFFGEDGNHEIYMDTHGYQHMISDVFVEICGTRTTGPTLTTPASNTGNGVHVTTFNDSIMFTNIHSWGNSLNGFYLYGLAHSLANCRAMNNGAAAVAGEQNGVKIGAGRGTNIVGGRFGNEGGGSVQQYGVSANNGATTTIGFSDLQYNNLAAWTIATNPTYLTAVGNLPINLDVLLSPSGGVLVGALATGGVVAASTINVAGGLLKNNVAYTNP